MARHVLRWGGWAVLIAIALNSYEVEAERVGGVVELGSGPSHHNLVARPP